MIFGSRNSFRIVARRTRRLNRKKIYGSRKAYRRIKKSMPTSTKYLNRHLAFGGGIAEAKQIGGII